MEFRMTLRGDVIIYEKDDFWNFVFVTDTQHTVKYEIGGVSKELRVENQDRKLILELRGADHVKRTVGAAYQNIFNMADEKLHGKTNGNANLVIQRSSPPHREIVHLKVGIGEVDGASLCSDYIYSRFPDGGEYEIGYETAREATLAFPMRAVSSSPPTVVLLEGGNPNPIAEWPDSNGSTTVTLDNDCGGTGSKEDFLRYYDWVRDTSEPRKFYLARKPWDCKDDSSKALMSVEGNCDPTRIDPPPYP